eukprot:scaffold60993_cov31-Tisochrysis_lutea.AAC.2
MAETTRHFGAQHLPGVFPIPMLRPPAQKKCLGKKLFCLPATILEAFHDAWRALRHSIHSKLHMTQSSSFNQVLHRPSCAY